MFEIRKIKRDEVRTALDLAMEVFLQFDTPMYKPEGTESFRRTIDNPDFIKNYEEGISPIYGAFDNSKLISIMGMRNDKTHINLVFTKKEYHHMGAASAVWRYLLSDLLTENPDLKEITLNAAPYGLGFYQHIGFMPTDTEQEIDGIRFTPMKYIIE